jgi:hypothetical protein
MMMGCIVLASVYHWMAATGYQTNLVSKLKIGSVRKAHHIRVDLMYA